MPQSRCLAAIMFADIAGYTAMMQEDEVLAMQVRGKFKKILEEEITAHKGGIERDPMLITLKYLKYSTPLMNDPRFKKLLQRIGFPE